MPQSVKLKMNGVRLPSLPKGKSSVEVFGDYLGYCTSSGVQKALSWIPTRVAPHYGWRAFGEDP
jgi:hypothetical protein